MLAIYLIPQTDYANEQGDLVSDGIICILTIKILYGLNKKRIWNISHFIKGQIK